MQCFYWLLFKMFFIMMATFCVCSQEIVENEINSTKKIEIELRYKILEEVGLQQFLSSLIFANKEHIIDVYLDTKDANLLERGIYIRVRNDNKIDFKFNRACLEDATLEYQPYCEEHSFTLPLNPEQLSEFNNIVCYLGLKTAQNFEEFKSQNEFIEHRVIDKVRSKYTLEDFVIVIDEVKDLGTFLEIELMALDTSNLDAITKRMDEILSPLKLERLKIGTEALELRKQNFQHYLKSRFILPEDKKLYELALSIVNDEMPKMIFGS